MYPFFTPWNHLYFNLKMISGGKIAIIWQINQFEIIHFFLMFPFYSPGNYKKIVGFSLFQGV